MADIHAAGAIMYRLDNGVPKYLILRSAHHGEWGPPKGRADGSEIDVETALREIYEETGFARAKFTPGFRETLSYMVNKKGRRLTKDVVFFLSEMPAQDLKISEEHNASHLGTIDEINAMVVHDDLKRVFQKAHAFLTKK
ncbi:MAG TPA: NUDIX domain-containing protein [Planctomycetota bacterium]|nr:NUDIX domain-containing protein [Planctomycetota bacterium]